MAGSRNVDAAPSAWRLLFARADDPAFVLDPATARILAVNKAGVELLGVPEAELCRTLWTDWVERRGADATLTEAEANASPFPGVMAFAVVHRPKDRPVVRGTAAWTAVDWATGPAVLSLHHIAARPSTPVPIAPSPNKWISADVRALGETAARLNAFTSTEECGLEVLRRVGQTLGRGEVRLLMVDAQGQLASTLSYTASDSSSTEPPIRLAMAESVTARVADAQAPGARPWFVMAPEDLPPPWRRLAPMVVMPVATGGQLQGLIVASMNPIPTGAEDYARCDAASAIASMLASTLRRLRLQTDLRRQQEKFDSLLRTIEAVSWLLDLETLAPRYLSPEVERVLGRHAHEFYEDPPLWMEIVHPEDREGVEAWYGEVARQRRDPLEYRVSRPDGQLVWVMARARLADHDESARPMLDGLLTNVTARRTADETLKAQARRNASLVAAIGQIVYEQVIGTGQMTWEGPVERVLGCSRDDLGTDVAAWLRRLHPDDRDRALEEFNWAFEHNRPYDVTYRLRRGDGTYAWLHDRGIPHVDQNERRERRIGVLTDVTDQRAAAELQAQIEHRLQHTQRLESIGLMASGVAHDFNNLLAGILGHLGLLLIEVGPESPLRGSLELAEAGALRASDLTRQLLVLAGRGQLTRTRVHMPRLVSEMAELLRSTIPAGIELGLNMPDDLPEVIGDASQLRQVVLNLITNGAQSIRSGIGRIDIDGGVESLRPFAPPSGLVGSSLLDGTFVAVRVRDNGAGISASIRDRIFDPFFSTRREGHGLGLAAVLGILKAHGGAIRVESQPDVGTTMTIYLPVLGPEPLPARDADTAVSDWDRTRQALVVESNRDFGDFLVGLLRRAGPMAHHVESWVQAQPLLERNNVGLLLLDEQIVRRQSHEALDEFRNAMRRIPTILVQDDAVGQEPLDGAVQALAVATVAKPIAARDMINVMREAMSRAKPQATTPPAPESDATLG